MTRTLIRLATNFRDYYDHWFVAPHDQTLARHTWQRNVIGGPTRSRQFQILEKAGYPVARNGIAGGICWKSDYLVMYVEPSLHRGQGKLVLPTRQAVEDFPNTFCSEFIPSTETPFEKAISHRHLFIGNRVFHLQYTATGDWRSNYGEVEIEVLETAALMLGRPENLEGQSPLLAIDYIVEHKTGEFFCVDLNISPGLSGTGLEVILPGKEVHSLIETYINDVIIHPF